MHAHWIYVFDGTDDDRVIRFVADNLHLVFFPTKQRFIDQNLRHGRGLKPRAAVILIFFAVIRHTAACAAQGKGGANDGGQTDVFQGLHRIAQTCGDVEFAVLFFRRCNDRGARVFKANTFHRLAEQLAVFGHFDCRALCPNHLDPEFLQHTRFFK